MTAPVPANAALVMSRTESNGFYQRAVVTSAFAEAIALRSKAMQWQAELTPVPQPAMPTRVDDDLDAWLEDVAQADAVERVRAAKYAALASLVKKCEAQVQGIVYQRDRQLASLARDLDAIMGTVAEVVDRLDGARNTGEVIDRGVADVWRELAPLRAEYDAVRQAQDWIMVGDHRVQHCRSEYLEDELATDLAIANLDRVFPDWKHAPQNQALRRWGGPPDPRPWPADPVEQLVWLVTSGAEAWVPTIRQLDELKQQRLDGRRHPDGQRESQPAPQILNEAPRAGYFDRIAPELKAVSPPAELAELGGEFQ